MMRVLVAWLAACAGLQSQTPDVVFLEPVAAVDTRGAEVRAKASYRVVDGARYRPWLEYEAAGRALQLYRDAYALLASSGNPQKQPAAYHIALVTNGNHAAVGFRLQTANGVEDHPRGAYILLDPEPRSFETTMLHETGHVAMRMLSGGVELPAAEVCSLPHTTAALVDRTTAFSEGWAIHLETLAAHLASSPALRARYHRGAVLFEEGPYRDMEFFRPAADVATYSQSLARYLDVRENHFAFQSAFRRGDPLRAQLEKARDFAALRDANQLLASEGFHASFFFLFTVRGDRPPTEALVRERQRGMLKAMQAMFERVKPEADTPWLLEFVESYAAVFPREKGEIVAALNDLSRGVFVDGNAPELWRKHYLAALRLDRKNSGREEMLRMRRAWNASALAGLGVLRSRVGPQVACAVPGVSIRIEAFGEAAPLLLDVNTAEEGVLRSVPGLAGNTLERWTAERARQPFRSLADFRQRVPGAPACR